MHCRCFVHSFFQNEHSTLKLSKIPENFYGIYASLYIKENRFFARPRCSRKPCNRFRCSLPFWIWGLDVLKIGYVRLSIPVPGCQTDPKMITGSGLQIRRDAALWRNFGCLVKNFLLHAKFCFNF